MRARFAHGASLVLRGVTRFALWGLEPKKASDAGGVAAKLRVRSTNDVTADTSRGALPVGL